MKIVSKWIAMSMLLFAISAIVQNTSYASPQNVTDVLPDFRPLWASDSLQDIAVTTANDRDRMVSCDDWTEIDPTPITGQRVLSFRLGSANLGQGHFRTRRELLSDGSGWLFYQTTSQIDESSTCSAVETPIAIVPTGGLQSGRWLPLAKFTLYTEAEDGGIGDPVVCQMKRWCCLVSIPTCDTRPPCSLPPQTDGINAGTRDVYPFHWLDQFVPIEGLPSGNYWFEHVINPANVFIESDYDNNTLQFKINIDQEAGRVSIVQPPDPTDCPSF